MQNSLARLVRLTFPNLVKQHYTTSSGNSHEKPGSDPATSNPVLGPSPDKVNSSQDHPAVRAANTSAAKNTIFTSQQVRGFGSMLVPTISGTLQPSSELNEALRRSRERIKELFKNSEFRLDNYLKTHPLPEGMALTKDGRHVIVYRADKSITSMEVSSPTKEKRTHPVQLPTVQDIQSATDAFIQSVTNGDGELDEEKLKDIILRHQCASNVNLVSVTWLKDIAEIIATNTEDELTITRAALMAGSPGNITVYYIPLDEILMAHIQSMGEFECLVPVAIPPNLRETCYVHPEIPVDGVWPAEFVPGNVSEFLHSQQEKAK